MLFTGSILNSALLALANNSNRIHLLPDSYDQGRWFREFGAVASLGWLDQGRITETIPDWFVDFFVSTRNLEAMGPGSADNCTMTTVEDSWCLYRLVQLAAPKRSLEIGIMRGSSSITIGRALSDAKIHCDQMAIDIDPDATAAAESHLKRFGLSPAYDPIVADSREWLPNCDHRWQFSFLDGDHRYDTVALEFAEVWNRTDPGGWIVLHDTGSALWGTNEDPGALFFRALDRELADSAEMTWLDATSCDVDMKLRTSMGLHVTLRPIAEAIAVGYGGMGMVRKLDNRRVLTPEQFASYKPTSRPIYAVPQHITKTRRVARRIASFLGI
jgi:predicted O-methyltransferase YrrM